MTTKETRVQNAVEKALEKMERIDTILQKMLKEKFVVFKNIIGMKSAVSDRGHALVLKLIETMDLPRGKRRIIQLNAVEQAIKGLVKYVEDNVMPSENFLIFTLAQEIEIMLSQYAGFDSRFLARFTKEVVKKGVDPKAIKVTQDELLNYMYIQFSYEPVFKGKALEQIKDTCNWLGGLATKLVRYNEPLYNPDNIHEVASKNLKRTLLADTEKNDWHEHTEVFLDDIKLWNQIQGRLDFIQELVDGCIKKWEVDGFSKEDIKKDYRYLKSTLTRLGNTQKMLRNLIIEGEVV